MSVSQWATILTAVAAPLGVVFAYLQGTRATRQEKAAERAAQDLAFRKQRWEERRDDVARLEREIARREAEIQDLRRTHAADIQDLRATHAAELAEERAEHERETAQMRSDLDLLRSTIVALGVQVASPDLRQRAADDLAKTDPFREERRSEGGQS